MKTLKEIQAQAADYAREITARTPKTVDDVYFVVKLPKNGEVSMELRIGGAFSSCAGRAVLPYRIETFVHIREWLEAVAREENQVESIDLGDGQFLHLQRIDIAEGAIRKTDRFLDEPVASPLGVLVMAGPEGVVAHAFCKVKHLVSNLYHRILLLQRRVTHSCGDYECKLRDTDAARDVFLDGARMELYNAVKSPLLEWYCQSSVSYREAQPNLLPNPHISKLVDMWADFGDSIFWDWFNISIGDIQIIYSDDGNYEFSDIPELMQWYLDFHELSDEFLFSGVAINMLEEHRIVEWQMRGYALAKKVRAKLPPNVDLMYSLSDFLAYGSNYYHLDVGHIVFDERLLVQE